MNNLVLLFLVGLMLFSALGILLSRRIVMAAFSFFAFLLSVACLFALLALHTAFVAQLIIYVGGVMVLVAFALYFYPDPEKQPSFKETKLGLGKAALLVPLVLACLYFFPWGPLQQWAEKQNPDQLPPSDKSLLATGQTLATQYVLEFEWLGIMMLAALVVAGWYIKQDSESINR
jgi:NADH-quinone oxidoreductase subunit J